jgi:hypothetical protein
MTDFPTAYLYQGTTSDRPYPEFVGHMAEIFHLNWDHTTCGDATLDFIDGLSEVIHPSHLCMLAEMHLLKHSKTEGELNQFFKKNLEFGIHHCPVPGKTIAEWMDDLIAATEKRIYGAKARLGQTIPHE